MIEFFNYLNSFQPLSAEATAALLKVMRAKELRRGQVWLQEGAVCDKLTFVVKGLMKLYFETGNKEVVLTFAREKEIIVSAESFYNQVPSVYSIRAVEPCIISYLPHTDVQFLQTKFSELNIHLLAFANLQVSLFEAHAAVLMLPARQRFFRIQELHEWMVDGSRLTDRLLAGYLGVTPACVSYWRNGKY